MSLTQVIPEKSKVTAVQNEDGGMVPSYTARSSCMSIDYRKLNHETNKDHFSLPF